MAEPQQGTHDYVVSGLKVRSQIEWPSAILPASRHESVDVSIERGEVPALLLNADRQGPDWAVRGDTFLLDIATVMRVLIRGGSRIVVQPYPTCDPGDLVLYLLGTCFAILLHQRGRVVLHASAVAVGDRAMLFCGPSGAGKSTMAALLGQRGYALLNDDVCNLSPQSDGTFVIYPDGRMLKLWQGSAEYLRWSTQGSARVREDSPKFYMEPERVDLTPRQIGGVYLLENLQATDPSIERLGTAEAMAQIADNYYRPALVQAQQLQAAYFAAAISIQRTAGVYRVRRPLDFARANDVLDLLDRHWSQS